MWSQATLTERVEVPVLVAFVHLTGYTRQVERTSDADVATTIDGLYELIGARISAAGGMVVKVIGDGVLIVFAPDAADAAVNALIDLREEADAYLVSRGWDCRMHVRVHLGPVVAGPFGPLGAKRFDVIGRTVNETARLPSTACSITPIVTERLSPATFARLPG